MNVSPKPPDRAFYESDPEAAEVRILAIAGLTAALDHIVTQNDTTRLIMDSATGLRERGVVPGMHVVESDDPRVQQAARDMLWSNPLMAAQFVAGQFLLYLGMRGALEFPTTLEETKLRNIDANSIAGALQMLDATN